MPKIEKLLDDLQHKDAQNVLHPLYGNDHELIELQVTRYSKCIVAFEELFPQNDSIKVFSAPGRTEVGGNHTDHNAGKVLAAAVNIDVIAVVAKKENAFIVVESEGYQRYVVNPNETTPAYNEKNTSTALIRGVCARMKEMGYNVGGFDSYITSSVPDGSGLSSSAAFEVLIVTILNHLYNDGQIDAVTCARIAQYAENVYFGKPCGLMDQTTSAVGGFVTIDFGDVEKPVVRKIEYDFASSGYSLVIVNTGGSHSDLTHEYASIKSEMIDVAKALGGNVLRDVSMDKVLDSLSKIRADVSDRAVLRALHFYQDNQRVVDEVDALEKNNILEFLRLIVESGYSSWTLCQNCYSHTTIHEQPLSIALAVSEILLKGRGGWRVQGGGFAGTIQAFVPHDLKASYLEKMRDIFGPDSCYDLSVRQAGAVEVHF